MPSHQCSPLPWSLVPVLAHSGCYNKNTTDWMANNNRRSFLTVWERFLTDFSFWCNSESLMKPHIHVHKFRLLHVSSHDGGSSWALFYRVFINPFHGGANHLWRPSQWPHLQILSHGTDRAALRPDVTLHDSALRSAQSVTRSLPRPHSLKQTIVISLTTFASCYLSESKSVLSI